MTYQNNQLRDEENSTALSFEETQTVLSIWQKTIDVQIHFNDIEMKIRNLFITVTLAAIAASGWLLEKKLYLSIGQLTFSYAIALLIVVWIAAMLFYLIDRYWFHQLLRGAVEQARAIDNDYGEMIPALGLTSRISGASPIKNFRHSSVGRIATFFRLISPPGDEENPADLHSNGKIELFYKTSIRIVQISLLVALVFGGLRWEGSSIADLALSALEYHACPETEETVETKKHNS